MKKILLTLLLAVTSVAAFAQTNKLFIRGNIDIKFNSKQTPGKGVKDVYTLNVNVANSALFHGTITDQPQIIEGVFSKAVTQPRMLNYDLACDVVNPKNPAQTKNVGRLYGTVPIRSDGSYQYDAGTLTVDILPIGNAAGFSSKFQGIAQGKLLGRPANWLETLQRQTVSITRTVNGKTSTVTLKKYDPMEFRNHIIGAGPVSIYQAVTVNGKMLYDYDKSCWFFQNIMVQYAENNVLKVDTLSGTIRWVESPQRAQNGEGEYQFDIRVNEPPPSASAAFDSKASDESSFFETDTTVSSLTGTMKYKDVLKGETTLASAVAIDLTGNNISKQQLMSLFKLVILSSVVPMNSD